MTARADIERNGELCIAWNEAGLVPAIAVDAISGRVLMLAWMNAEALERTLATGQAHYYSRSRQRLWKKGETSGAVQRLRELRVDCDQDTILLIVDQAGEGACHTGARSCFYRRVARGADGAIRLAFVSSENPPVACEASGTEGEQG
ncbi:MAG: phosphoribosyl-AMP cyclohydrolase [Alphaproteobacteria bacterium]|nr:MAG: phosphoribosyl-AMP cyclohydrolase [Alphaproteobacteria bacterium]